MDGKERQLQARRDGRRQGETAAGKERRPWARRDGHGLGETAAARRDSGRQGEMMGGSSGARRDGRGGARKCAPNQWGPGPEQIYSTAAGHARSVIRVTWATPGRKSGELGQFLSHSLRWHLLDTVSALPGWTLPTLRNGCMVSRHIHCAPSAPHSPLFAAPRPSCPLPTLPDAVSTR